MEWYYIRFGYIGFRGCFDKRYFYGNTCMYIQEISIDIKAKVNKDELMDEFSLLMSSYRNSGQTQGRLEKINELLLYPLITVCTIIANSKAIIYPDLARVVIRNGV